MKYPLILAVLLYALLLEIPLKAQFIFCGTEQVERANLNNSPIEAMQQKLYESNYRKWMHNTKSRNGSASYILPIVFHIVHDCVPIGSVHNPTKVTIQEILNRTNQRFRHQHLEAQNYANPYYGVDTGISFCLARYDTNGAYTSGIVRHNNPIFSNNGSANQADFFSRQYKWTSDKYINVFIVQSTDVAGVYYGGRSRDIIIINATSFWDGLLTHELGHYFSLKHTFYPDSNSACPNNDNCLIDGDFVCDTPPKNRSGTNGGRCNASANSCSTDENDSSNNNPYRAVALGGMGDQSDMLNNYMDYTGNCWDAFTLGQKERMLFNIENQRISLTQSHVTSCTAEIPEYALSLENTQFVQIPSLQRWQPNITIKNIGSATLKNIQIQIDVNDNPYAFTHTLNLVTGNTTIIQTPSIQLSTGTNMINLNITSVNGEVSNHQYCTYIESTDDKMNTMCERIEYDTTIIACENQRVEGHFGPGVYKDTFRLDNGCDSIRTLTINVTAKRIITHINQSICAGTSFEGHSQKGTYVDVFKSSTNCDSVRILDLQIEAPIVYNQHIHLCQGESYNDYTKQGIYKDTLITDIGCDSIIITELTTERCKTTNLQEDKPTPLLYISPNPAKHHLYIKWLGQNSMHYLVYNTAGAIMNRGQLLTTNTAIPISGYPKGIYFIYFSSESGQFIRKVIVQ